MSQPEINPIWFGVAMYDLQKAADAGDARKIYYQRCRLKRMLRNYATHPDVQRYAERHLRVFRNA